MQWLQDPNQGNEDNLNNVRREPSRYFRNKNKEYLKANIGELDIKDKLKNTETCTVGTKIVRRITSLELIQYGMRWLIWLQTATVFWLVRWRKHFSLLFNVQGVEDVRQKYIQQNHKRLCRVPLRLRWLLES